MWLDLYLFHDCTVILKFKVSGFYDQPTECQLSHRLNTENKSNKKIPDVHPNFGLRYLIKIDASDAYNWSGIPQQK